MKVTSEKLPGSQVLLNIEVDEAAVDKSVEQAYRRLAAQVNIPGFRRGKAPRHLIERYVGKDTLLQEGVEKLVPDVYRQAVEETGIQPIDQPELDVVQMRPLIIKATVPVEPTVELGDYQEIRLTPVEVAVSEQQVNDVVERLREQRAEWSPVERPVKAGDLVNIDVEAVTGVPIFYSSSGEPILQMGGGEQVMSHSGLEVEVNPERDEIVPGLAAQLVGMTVGQEKKFRLTLPQDYADKARAGKDAVFRVVLHNAKEKHLPDLNDEFAKTVGEYETLEQMRNYIRITLQRSLEREAREQFESLVIQAAVDRSRVELPSSLIEREADRMLNELKSSLSAQRVPMEEYLRVTGRANEEELKQQLRPEAERRLRTYFVMNAIGRAEGIEVAPSEIQEEIDRVAERVGEQGFQMRRFLETPERRENISLRIWNQKTIDRLVSIAKGEAEAVQAEEPAEVAQTQATSPSEGAAEQGKPSGPAEEPTEQPEEGSAPNP